MASKIKVGDFVCYRHAPRHKRFIFIYLDCPVLSEIVNLFHQVQNVKMFTLKSKEKGDYFWGDSVDYTKINPSKYNIKIAKIKLKEILKDDEIDNLTYIELYARLKRYEQSL